MYSNVQPLFQWMNFLGCTENRFADYYVIMKNLPIMWNVSINIILFLHSIELSKEKLIFFFFILIVMKQASKPWPSQGECHNLLLRSVAHYNEREWLMDNEQRLSARLKYQKSADDHLWIYFVCMALHIHCNSFHIRSSQRMPSLREHEDCWWSKRKKEE